MKPTSAPWTTKIGHDRQRPRAKRAQDGDVGLLVGDRHDQRRYQVEGSDSDDQREDDEHHVLFDLHGAEEIGVAFRPVADIGVGIDDPGQLAGDARRLEQVVDLEPHAADPVTHLVQRLRVLQVDQRKAAVVLVHADFEYADNLERFQARQHAGRGYRALRRDQRHLVAGEHTQRARQVGAEHDAEFAGAQVVEAAALDRFAEIGDAVFLLGIDTAHQRALDPAVNR